MSTVINRVSSPGTDDTQVTYSLFDRQSTKSGSPIVKTISISYDKIQNAFVKIQLYADKTATVPQAPAILGGGYTLVKLTVNGRDFNPSSPTDSNNLIQNQYSTDKNLLGTLNPNGENTVAISFLAPFGAGVISPDSQISAQLIVLGTETSISKTGLTGLPSVSDISSQLQNWINQNTPTFIAVLALLAVIIAAIAYLASRVPHV